MPVWILVLAGLGVSFFEYCLAVPDYHCGHGLALKSATGRNAMRMAGLVPR